MPWSSPQEKRRNGGKPILCIKLVGFFHGIPNITLFFLFPIREAEESSKIRAPTAMKSFEQSAKSQKTVKSMIETRGEKPKEKTKNKKNKGPKKEGELVLGVSNDS